MRFPSSTCLAATLRAGNRHHARVTTNADTPDPMAGRSGSVMPASDAVELIGHGLVLSNRSHGSQLCLGAVAASSPPQGGGPDLPNWDWDKVEGQTSKSGTTFGAYVVIGQFDTTAHTFRGCPGSRRS